MSEQNNTIELNEQSAAQAVSPLARQQGMTLIEILIVVGLIALVMGLVIGPRLFSSQDSSQRGIAKIAVDDIAGQTYLAWRAANPGKQCPGSINDLAPYRGGSNAKDPWGADFAIYCGPTAPSGCKGMCAASNGPDGKPNTEDDIKSWGEGAQ
ncbi:MAG: prepilin-type N-terminal cleavage/methylation domain-containing protein [Myxococcales bacterium]|nr:prepilin-type N-terminal cleavage/methylation domain-containing protein [Myxococcales bacterium]